MKLKINISTCPNDTFMFDAMLHKKTDVKGVDFELFMGDIDNLNSIAYSDNVDISKLSFAAYPKITDRYQILNSGSALGFNSGPLLVSRKNISLDDIPHIKIGIPGETTTANMLLKSIFNNKLNTKTYLFSDISTAILDNEIDAGVLIHEERFLYNSKGLRLVCDLGQKWEELTKLPIPLGCIVINRDLDLEIKKSIESMISESILYALKNPQSSYNFVKQHAKELSDEVIKKHIDMFVNKYSVSMGNDGKSAIMELFSRAGHDLNEENIFI